MVSNELWSGSITGKTGNGQDIYFASLTDKQVWWDTDPYFSICNAGYGQFAVLKNIVDKRCNLMYDTVKGKYSLPVNVLKMEYVD